RVMGQKPAPLGKVAEFTHKMKAMVRGEEVMYGECAAPVRFTWATGYELPVWIAAYGPMALKCAGENGDGLVLQIAEPGICKWLGDQAVTAGLAAGRDMSEFRIMAAAPAMTGAMDDCIERTKWFPAMVGNHIADIVEKYGADSDLMPQSLTAYIEKRRGYDYSKHGQSDNTYLDFITEDIVKGFAVLGEPDSHVEKLRQLQKAGVTQFNVYLDSGHEEKIIADYAEQVIPAFNG
ncbi:MAG: TIGR03842 family LLM class F420-dependent oxidoreductase, partial [Alphaproteobacteria bacterium]